MLARCHLVYNIFLSAQVAVRNKAKKTSVKKQTNRGTTITTNTVWNAILSAVCSGVREMQKNCRARSRTWNLLIRSQVRYPLRHWPTSCWVLCFHKSCLFWTFQRPELLFNYIHFIERPAGGQPFPGSLVVTILHSHRRGPV